jgi:hypothetical protein
VYKLFGVSNQVLQTELAFVVPETMFELRPPSFNVAAAVRAFSLRSLDNSSHCRPFDGLGS